MQSIPIENTGVLLLTGVFAVAVRSITNPPSDNSVVDNENKSEPAPSHPIVKLPRLTAPSNLYAVLPRVSLVCQTPVAMS